VTNSLSYVALGVAAGVALAGVSEGALQAAAASTDRLALFAEVFNKVRDNYAEKPDDDQMIKAAIDGMLASLDPHSTYFDAKALQDFQSSMKGEEFGGLGLEVMMEDGLVKAYRRHSGQGPEPQGSRRQDARPSKVQRSPDRPARREQGPEGLHYRSRDHSRAVGEVAS
jgi:C-terminal processing protease CtpA/Prc